jgi:competence ComEA-like helix-hairpin-helix protein
MNWRDFFYFSRGERRALIVLLCLITLTTALLILTNNLPDEKEPAVVDAPKQPDTVRHVSSPSEVAMKSSSPTSSRTARRNESVSERVNRLTSTNRRSAPTYTRIEKLATGSIVELNAADSFMLQKVPGIGPAFARRIVRYRERLGGFHSVSQLSEVYGIDAEKYAELSPWFTVDASLIQPIPINALPADTFLKHPYINYNQARAIRRLRIQKKQRLTGWENLQLMKEFTDEDKARIEPYILFE